MIVLSNEEKIVREGEGKATADDIRLLLYSQLVDTDCDGGYPN